MFEDLRNTGNDHLCASSSLIPEESPLINLGGGDDGSEDVDSDELEEVTSPKGKGKGGGGVLLVVTLKKERSPRHVLDNGCKIKLVKLCLSTRGLQLQSNQW
jgi:hypothetical protein